MSKIVRDSKGYRILLREQRLKVYARALKTYSKHASILDKITSLDYCDGMCGHINNAIHYLGYDRKYAVNNCTKRKYWPEYYSFKPKKGWEECPDFWMTRRKNFNGHKKRVAILTALAEGKSKGE